MILCLNEGKNFILLKVFSNISLVVDIFYHYRVIILISFIELSLFHALYRLSLLFSRLYGWNSRWCYVFMVRFLMPPFKTHIPWQTGTWLKWLWVSKLFMGFVFQFFWKVARLNSSTRYYMGSQQPLRTGSPDQLPRYWYVWIKVLKPHSVS